MNVCFLHQLYLVEDSLAGNFALPAPFQIKYSYSIWIIFIIFLDQFILIKGAVRIQAYHINTEESS